MEKIISKVGIMIKHPGEMNASEVKEWKQRSYERAKQYLFSIGQPFLEKLDSL